MSREDNILKISLYDILLKKVIHIVNMNIKDETIFDSEGNVVGWNDIECISLGRIVPYKDMAINAILLFGDGTLEFRDDNSEEAFNWSEFSNDFIEKIISLLNDKIIDNFFGK